MLRDAMDRALAEVGKTHGVAFKVGNISYSANLATAKVEFAAVGEDGSVNTREAQDFERLYTFYGFERDDLGREFKSRGRTYKLLGLNQRARKNPVIVRDVVTGKDYKMTVGAALVGLGHKTAAQVVAEFGGYV